MRLPLLAVASITLCGSAAFAQAPPPIPPIADTDRIQSYTITSSTSQIQVGFPVFGDCTDLTIYIAGTQQLVGSGLWNCASSSGVALSLKPLPITDMVVNFTPPITTGTVVVLGGWHPRELIVPTAPGINRREFQEAIGTLIAGQRELFHNVNTVAGGVLPGVLPPNISPCRSAGSLGFVADGVTDNLGTWNAWVAGLGTLSACLEGGPGTYLISGPATATLVAGQTINILGTGQDATEFYFPNTGNGFVFTLPAPSGPGYITGASVSVEKAAITTNQAGAGDGLKINGSTTNGYIPKQTNISYVAFRGRATGKYWTRAINLQDLSDVFIDHVGIYGPNALNTLGTGILYNGTSSGTTPTVINVSNLTAFFLGTGISTTGNWQGLNVTQTNLTDVGVGVSCSATGAQQPECSVTNSQINSIHHGMMLTNVNASEIANNLFYQGAYSGGTNGEGIIAGTSFSFSEIVGNFFNAFTVGGTTSNCIDLGGAGNSGISITANFFSGCVTNIVLGASPNIAIAANVPLNFTNHVTGGGAGNILVDAGRQANIPNGTAVGVAAFSAPAYTFAASPTTGFTFDGSNAGISIGGVGQLYASSSLAVSTPPFSVAQIQNTGAVPAITGGGTSASIDSASKNAAGQVTFGNPGATTMTVTFAASGWPNNAWCTLTPKNTFVTNQISTQSKTAFTITLSGVTNGAIFNYNCQGN